MHSVDDSSFWEFPDYVIDQGNLKGSGADVLAATDEARDSDAYWDAVQYVLGTATTRAGLVCDPRWNYWSDGPGDLDIAWNLLDMGDLASIMLRNIFLVRGDERAREYAVHPFGQGCLPPQWHERYDMLQVWETVEIVWEGTRLPWSAVRDAHMKVWGHRGDGSVSHPELIPVLEQIRLAVAEGLSGWPNAAFVTWSFAGQLVPGGRTLNPWDPWHVRVRDWCLELLGQITDPLEWAIALMGWSSHRSPEAQGAIPGLGGDTRGGWWMSVAAFEELGDPVSLATASLMRLRDPNVPTGSPEWLALRNRAGELITDHLTPVWSLTSFEPPGFEDALASPERDIALARKAAGLTQDWGTYWRVPRVQTRPVD